MLPVFIDIATKDTSEELQSWAIDYISEHTKDKNRSVQTLIDIFHAVPKQREEQRRQIFYAIADVGNDRAVDFLGTVARTSEDYHLRREAVFYLGNIGTDMARAVLYGILQGK